MFAQSFAAVLFPSPDYLVQRLLSFGSRSVTVSGARARGPVPVMLARTAKEGDAHWRRTMSQPEEKTGGKIRRIQDRGAHVD